MIEWIRPTGTPRTAVRTGQQGQPASREAFFLRRLSRLTELRARWNLEPGQRRQVDHALYATYWDCVGLGLRAEAATIVGLPPQSGS